MTRLGVIVGVLAGAVQPALGQEAVTPRAFCMAVEPSLSARRICEDDYERSMMLFIEYGRAQGYIDAEGEFSFSRVLKDAWSWRILVGLPPKSPFLNCAAKASGQAMVDFRAVWDCIAARDPMAARMDAI